MSYKNLTAVGQNAYCNAVGGIAIGMGSVTNGGANARGTNAVALGYTANAANPFIGATNDSLEGLNGDIFILGRALCSYRDELVEAPSPEPPHQILEITSSPHLAAFHHSIFLALCNFLLCED